jgi:hypothetical protein
MKEKDTISILHTKNSPSSIASPNSLFSFPLVGEMIQLSEEASISRKA